MTIVRRGTNTPVFVDRITATGFDLDSAGTTGTDDIYFTDVEAPYLSDQSDVIYGTGNYAGGHNFAFQGKADGNCTDSPGTPVPACRAAASWVGGPNNQISSIRVRFQNDNAYGTSTSATAYRLLQLSLEVVHAEQLISDTRDRGDAPASYGDALHPITSLTTLLSNGLAPDNDQSVQFSIGADADDSDTGNTGTTGIAKYDDEDSVLRNGLPLSDQTLDAGATETFSVLTFGGGYLSAWIDLNIDGDFADAGEKILNDVQISNTTVSTTPVSVDIPQDASGGNTYVRFRFNNDPGLGPSGPGVDGEAEDYRVVIAAMDPTYNMVKSANPATVTSAGVLTYTFLFNNTGNAILTNLTVSDPNIDSGSLSGCPIATLNPGQSAACTATRTISQTQVDSGQTLTNTASTSGTNPLGGPAVETTTADNTVTTPVVPTYTLGIDMVQPVNADEDGTGDISAGDTLTYTITATNTGTATVSNLQVMDAMITPSSSNCASVAPGGTCTLTGTYTVTVSDLGTALSNSATADSDQTAQVSDTETVNPPQPVLTLSKSAPVNADEDSSTDISVGDTLTYTVTATNSGAAALTNVSVEDVKLSPSSQVCASLAPGATCVLTGAYTVIAGDIGAGSIINTATADSNQTAELSDSVTTSVPAPALSLNKAAPANLDNDNSTDISAGDVLTYTITATNSGNAVLTGVTVNDPMLTPATTTCDSLAVNAACVLTGIYTVTTADVTSGSVDNTATADSVQTTQMADTETVSIPNPALVIDIATPINADPDNSGDISQGDVLTYTVTATNAGSATLTNVIVNDDSLSPNSNSCATVPPNQTCVLSGTYTVTAADINAGTISQSATADSDQAASVDATDTVNVPVPNLSLDLSAPVNTDNDLSTDVSAGDVLTYTVTATNTGTAILTGVIIDDPLLNPSSTNCATLAVGDTCVLTGTYTVTATDVTATTIDNTATTRSDQTGQLSDTEVVAVPSPALSLVKPAPVNNDADGSGDVSAGDTLTYTITATNTGTAVLTNVLVTDPLKTPDAISCATLAVGDSCELVTTYPVTAGDISAGAIDSTATANSDQTDPLDANQSVPLGAPALSLVKPAPINSDEDGSGDVSADDTLTYTITANNSGASNLTNVVVTDPLLTPDSATCALLSPTATCVLSGTYRVTDSDVSAGFVDNTASADSDQTLAASAAQTVNVPTPGHSLSQSAPINSDEDGSGDISVNDTLTYSITATNTGTATLTNLLVSDPQISPASQTCPVVAVGDSCTLTGTYKVTSVDIGNGSIANTASAISDQSPLIDDTQTVSTPNPQHSLTLDYTTNADEDGSADISLGDTLTFVATATNTGAATLTNLTVSDTMLTPDNTLCAIVPTGATCVLTGTYTVTAADVAAGTLVTTATSGSNQTAPLDDSETLAVPQPALIVSMADPVNADEDATGDISAGDTLSYTVTATNNGTATLTNVTVSDPMIAPANQDCGTVAPGESCVLSGTYTVTTDDVSNAAVNNTATANSDQTDPTDVTNNVNLLVPDLAINKPLPTNTDEDGSGDISVGDTLTYAVTATNNGTATLTGVIVSDPGMTPDTATCASVPAAATCVLSGTYVVTADDVSSGQINSTATAISNQTNPVTANQSVPVFTPQLSLAMPAPANADQDGSGDISAGDVLTYTITATNTGSTTLTHVDVEDPMLTPTSTTCAVLTQNETCVLTGQYTVVAADVTAGSIDNTASTVAVQTSPLTDQQSVPVGRPSHTLDMATPTLTDADASNDISAGDTLTYTITATNNGAANLTNLVINDPLIDPDSTTCANVTIGDTCLLTGTYVVTNEDVIAGTIDSTAISNTDQTGQQTDTEKVSLNAPALGIDMATPVNADEDGSGDISVGDTLTYTSTATNTGAANLTNVVVNDPRVTPVTTTCASVSPGATCVLTGTYVVTSDDLSNGNITNIAEVNSDQTAPVTDTEVVNLLTPFHTLDMATPVNADEDSSGDISVNDTLTYNITATNSGSATLTNLEVTDPLLTPDTMSCATVAAGETCVLTGTYTVTQSDVSAGVINNTATSTSNQTSAVEDTETVSVPQPALSLTKAAPTHSDTDGSGDVSADNVLTYTVSATNTGTATLTNVVVNDALLSPSTTTCATVVAGDSCILTGSYTVTPDDVNSGTLNSTATADADQTPEIDTTHTLPIAQPALVLDTSAPVNTDNDSSGDISAGDVLTYTVTASNTGDATLTNIVINDPLLAPNQTTCASLTAGNTCTLTGEYTVSTTDVSAGNINNIADADSDQTAVVTDSELVTVPNPLHTLSLSTPVNADNDTSGDSSVGDVLTYTVTATNTGTAVLTNLEITEPMIAPSTTTCTLVAVGDVCVLTGDYTVTAADVTNGSISNTATSISDQSPRVDDAKVINLDAPGLSIDQPAPAHADADNSGDISAGDTLTYTVTASNTGSSNLTNVVVNDPRIQPSTQRCATLTIGADCVLIGEYLVTAADVAAGTIASTATADSVQTPSVSDDEIVAVPSPELILAKPAPQNGDQDNSGDISAGDVLTYTITATNNGTAVLTSVTVDDPMITPSTTRCEILPPAATCVLTGTYIITADDVASGAIQGTATADSLQSPAVSESNSVLLPTPDLTVVKTAPLNADEDASGDVSVGDTLTYTITATNSGSATLTNVQVDDPLLTPSNLLCAEVTSGDTCILTGIHVVTAANVSSGTIDGTASADSDQVGPVTDTHSLPLSQPALSLAMTPPVNADEDGSGDISAADTLTYTIIASNSGSATLTNVIVDDPMLTPTSVTCATVPSNDSCMLTGTYTVTASDVGTGVINNTASAQSLQTPSASVNESVVVPTPIHTLVMSTPANTDNDNSGDISAGDVLTYTLTAKNTGTATLTNLTIDDAKLSPATKTCASVTTTNTCVLTGAYTVTAADIILGSITNSATSVADQSATVDATQSVSLNAPSLAIDYPAPVNSDEDGSNDVSAGDTLTYTVTATNNGSSNLTDVSVNHPAISPDSFICPSVVTGETCVLVGTYTVTDADITAGSITTTASAVSNQTTVLTDDEIVPVRSPQLTLSQTEPVLDDRDGSGDISSGDVLTYTATATNSGDANLTNVVVDDPLVSTSSVTCALISAGATCVLSGDYTVTETDVTATNINNTVTASADQTSPLQDSQVVDLPLPQLAIVKSDPVNTDEDSSGDVSIGDTLTYTITATNTGSATLTDVVVTDLMITPSSIGCSTLTPGSDCRLIGTYTVTGADIASGSIGSTSNAISDQVAQVFDDNRLALLQPSITLETAAPANDDEDGSGDISAGDTLTYTTTASNSGSSTLTNVVVNDPLTSPGSASCTTLATGETCVLSGTYTVTAADVLAGVVNNTANSVSDQTTAIEHSESVLLPTPTHSLVKSAPTNTDNDNSGDISVGDTLAYTVTATNTGSANLTNLVINDLLITPDTTTCALVNAGDTCLLSGTYTVTAADIDTGSIAGIATSESDQSALVTDDQTTNLNAPSLTITTQAPVNADEDNSTDLSVGDTLTYTITATNNGMATLTNVVVSDPTLVPATETCESLAAGANCVLIGTYRVTEDDLATGAIGSNASADSDQTASVADSVTTPVPYPELTLQTAPPVNDDQDGSGDISNGDELTYTITAINTGTAVLTNLGINTPGTSPMVSACVQLAPGASCIHTGTYIVTGDDVLNGTIEKTATAVSPQGGTATDTETTTLAQPELTLVMTAPVNADNDSSADASAGDVLSYTVTATNSGSATLTAVTVSDPMLGSSTTVCNAVGAGETCVLEGSYTITSADVEAGTIVNSATAHSAQTPSASTEQTTLLPVPSMTLSNTVPVSDDADGSGDLSAGDTLTYTVSVTNNGTANLTDITVSDALINPDTTSCAITLPGETCTLTGTYTLTPSDVATGEVVNTVSASSPQTGKIEDTVSQNLAGPDLRIDQLISNNADEDGSTDISAGDTLTYVVTASNTGNANLTSVQITHQLITPQTEACAMLSPGEICTLTGSYVVTAADVTEGTIETPASAASDQTQPATDTLSAALPKPAYALLQTLTGNADEDSSGDISAGDTLTYTVTATNNGTATLTSVDVVDALLTPTSAQCASLAPANDCVLTGTYVVTSADVANQAIVNTASVNSDQLTAISDSITVTLNTPAISIEKVLVENRDEDNSGDVSFNDTLYYSVTATNSGTSALTNVQVADTMLSPSAANCLLVPVGANCILTGSYRVTAEDVDKGTIAGTADISSDQTPPATATNSLPLEKPAVSLVNTLVNFVDHDNTGGITVDNTLHYSVVATNTGTAALTNVTVASALLAPNATNCSIVLPLASCTLDGYYIVTDTDVTAGSIVQTATVDSDQTPSIEKAHATEVAQPMLTLVTSAPTNVDNDGSGHVTPGDVLTYTITATNTGEETLSNVDINSPLIAPNNISCALLAPGDTCVLIGDYTVAANDEQLGEVTNRAAVLSDQTSAIEATHTQAVMVILPPVTTDNSISDLPLGIPAVIAVLSDDTDPENNIDPTSVRLIHPVSAESMVALEIPGEGHWAADPVSGDVTFTPEQGYLGSPTSILYKVADTTGLESNPSRITLSFEQPASLTGTVWLDINRDGEIDAFEPVMPNWTLQIFNDAGDMVATTTTDSDGVYAVEDLIPAEYTMHFLNEAGVFMAESTTGGVLEAGQTINLPLPIDPSGVVYDSITRKPIPGVTVNLVNSAGVVIDPVCLNTNQQGQTTQADGYYAFDVFPEAHPSCPLDDVYSIQVASIPATYQGLSTYLLAETATFDSDSVEANCTVDAIPASGACEIQPQSVAPQNGEDTTYFMSFRLAAGDTNVIFNHIPLDPFLAAALADLSIQKTAARRTVSTGDVLTYTIKVRNTQAEGVSDVSVTDDLPNGFYLVPESVIATTFDNNGVATASSRVATSGDDPVVFSGLTIPGLDDGEVAITYAVRVGASLVQGKYINTAEVSAGGSSNTAQATVAVTTDSVLDGATLIGKVFHDRDNDGYQDNADATRITVSSASGYFGDKAYLAGDLNGRSGAGEPAPTLVVRIPYSSDNSFVVRTSEGSILSADNNHQITESHVGQRAHGLTAQDIRVTTQVTQMVPTLTDKQQSAVLTKVLEITISNYGVYEEGIPGVRLASVSGIVVETDKAGRFHIPDVDTGRDGIGQQTIVKLDTATIPRQARLTTENPRVLRITNTGLNTMRFGVSLANDKGAEQTNDWQTQQTVEVKLGSIFFDAGKDEIRADQRGAIADIIKHLKAHGSGRILIQAHTDARNTRAYNIALAGRRAKTVERQLRAALGSSLLENVTVDVDTSAYTGGTDNTNPSTENQEPGQ